MARDLGQTFSFLFVGVMLIHARSKFAAFRHLLTQIVCGRVTVCERERKRDQLDGLGVGLQKEWSVVFFCSRTVSDQLRGRARREEAGRAMKEMEGTRKEEMTEH